MIRAYELLGFETKVEHIQAEKRRAAISVTGEKGKLPGSESDVYMDGRASFTNTIMTVNKHY